MFVWEEFYLFAQVERNHAVVLGVEDQHRAGDVVHTDGDTHTGITAVLCTECKEQTAVPPHIHWRSASP